MTVIGIDIGGTKVCVGLVDVSGRVLLESTFPTSPRDGFHSALAKIVKTIEHVLSQTDENTNAISGIGIGCTGPIDPLRGTIHNPYTLPTWDGCDLVTPLRERFGVPIRMENDADAAALGEYAFGAGQQKNPMAMLTFGTGIGFGLIVDGCIYRGVDGSHPEVGHIPTKLSEPECYCGMNGCFESIASGASVDRAALKIGLANSRAVFAEAKLGHPRAIAIVDEAMQATTTAAWTLIHSFLPERIVLGGGMIDDQFDYFANAIQQAVAKSVMVPGNRVSVVRASLGNLAGVVGAACLVLKRRQIGS